MRRLQHRLPGKEPLPQHRLPGKEPLPQHRLPGKEPLPQHRLPGKEPLLRRCRRAPWPVRHRRRTPVPPARSLPAVPLQTVPVKPRREPEHSVAWLSRGASFHSSTWSHSAPTPRPRRVKRVRQHRHQRTGPIPRLLWARPRQVHRLPRKAPSLRPCPTPPVEAIFPVCRRLLYPLEFWRIPACPPPASASHPRSFPRAFPNRLCCTCWCCSAWDAGSGLLVCSVFRCRALVQREGAVSGLGSS